MSRWWLVGAYYRPVWWCVSPAFWLRMWRARRARPRVDETVTLFTPSGEARIVLPAGEHGGWEVYVRDTLLSRGASAVAPHARDRGFVIAADELQTLGMALLEVQASG